MQKKTLKPSILKEKKSGSRDKCTTLIVIIATGEIEAKHSEILEWKKAFRQLQVKNYYTN